MTHEALLPRTVANKDSRSTPCQGPLYDGNSLNSLQQVFAAVSYCVSFRSHYDGYPQMRRHPGQSLSCQKQHCRVTCPNAGSELCSSNCKGSDLGGNSRHWRPNWCLGHQRSSWNCFVCPGYLGIDSLLSYVCNLHVRIPLLALQSARVHVINT